jgi:SdpC family antimicrobial peptide
MLRKINKWASKAYVMLPLVGLFAFVSCRKESHVPTTQQSMQAQKTVNSIAKLRSNFTAEDYLKGIFFVSGPVADFIPELADYKIDNFTTNKNTIEYIRLKEDKIIETLKKQNPTFLNHFKEEITSGDQIKIKVAINEAAVILKPIFDLYYNLNDIQVQKNIDAEIDKLKASKNLDANDASKTKEAIKNILGTQNPTSVSGSCGLIYLFVVIVVFVFGWAFGGGTPAYRTINNDGLYKDKLVNSIAVNLQLK